MVKFKMNDRELSVPKGTTILAAVREGYEAVGIEKTAVYYKLGSDRVKFALAAGNNQ